MKSAAAKMAKGDEAGSRCLTQTREDFWKKQTNI